MSSTKNVFGGISPQGTKLGNLLFCLSIDDIVHGESNIVKEINPTVSPASMTLLTRFLTPMALGIKSMF